VKALKVIAAVLAGIAALIVGLAAILFMLVDSAWTRRELARIVEAETQRSLQIGGGLALFLWPRPGLRAERVSLSERQRPEEFAAFEAASVQLAFLPLLEGRISVHRIEVEGWRVTLVRRRDGSLNIADLLDRPRASSTAMPLPAAGIELRDGTLTWRNEQGGRDLVVSGLEFSTGPIEAGAAGHVRLSAIRLQAQASRGEASLMLSLGATLDADSGSGIHVLAPLQGRLDLGHPQLPQQGLQLPLDGRLRLDLGKGGGQGSLASRLDGSPVNLTLALSRFSPPALSFELVADRIDLDRYLPLFQDGDDPSASSGAGFDPGAASGMELQGLIRIGELHFAGSRTRDFRLQVSGRDGRLRYDGQTGPPSGQP
jgi:AsmA protein